MRNIWESLLALTFMLLNQAKDIDQTGLSSNLVNLMHKLFLQAHNPSAWLE